ncbi:membrane protein insertase YidC [Pseudorhodobacter sp. E13]|uniref:membrane protein insertase YidC n=1 Tax=Pseudorhodobacter sp. E13 TaxID=2487931 RepID=UPI000F8D48F3|nr:membrane protein insertase YidC [Pseudorhodobacter sp. E13]RUS58606.1 membrane protein insertase YidC [Pseudorhodobacter sp. E13]
MDDQNKNLILATVLSFLVILVWFVLFPPEEPVVDPNAPAVVATTNDAVTPPAATATGEPATAAAPAQSDAPRVAIETDRVKGSISLLGGRLDDLALKSYKVTIDPTSDIVTLLSPIGKPQPYYALYGWLPAGSLGFEDVPGANTLWSQVGTNTLTTETPITLQWDNGKGLVFQRVISIDNRYMFNVTQSVENNGTTPVSLAPYGIVARHGLPADLEGFYLSHEGIVLRADGVLEEVKYKDATKLPLVDREAALAEVVQANENGWIGFTSKYWMTALIPEQGKPFTAVTKYAPGADIYQTETRQPVITVAPGASAAAASRLFAGAKEWESLRAYQNDGGVGGFIDAIDWGWFFFFTKPIFAVLHWLNAHIGNMGLAIIALTFLLKALVLPLAYKSYVSMARMKELQPEMEALKERAGDDKQKLQKEMMALYKEKKVNPAAGCLPILIQIPIFFSLYKVIFVTLELRHAPFFGWLNDLSGPDSSSIFNLFGLLPWAAPEPGSMLALIFIGVLPLLLGISMWLQQKLNPTPTEPTQAMIFAWMPWVFMFMLGSFASGLVVYWITNNVITFTQQFAIMKSHGHSPDIFGNIKSSFKRKPVVQPPAKKQGKK